MSDSINTSGDNGEGFSSIDLVCQCLIDQDKFNAFQAVLSKTITKDSNVLEFGTGSGILSLICARLGAQKVTAVEYDPYIASVANQNVFNNGYQDKINVVCGDARKINFNQVKFDVLVMEMLATGLVDEMQVTAMNNLHNQKILSENATVVPYAQENYISLAETDFSLYGFNMKMIRHLWSHDDLNSIFQEVSEKVLLNKVNFSVINDEHVTVDLEIKVLKDATINSLCLTSRVIVDSGGSVILDSTHSLSPIVIIPMEENSCKSGDLIRVNIDYTMGGGFSNFKARYI